MPRRFDFSSAVSSFLIKVSDSKLSGTLTKAGISSSSVAEFSSAPLSQQQMIEAFDLFEKFDPASGDISEFMHRLKQL